jgi:hypothetical protein
MSRNAANPHGKPGVSAALDAEAIAKNPSLIKGFA